jgi:prepilin-type N-terminal cleavage/methylation domain-containing protein/prepilin-type processing-associated H-X9-DG protein
MDWEGNAMKRSVDHVAAERMAAERMEGNPGGRLPSSGFTLVELLVVVSISGVLISLVLPAVEAAREAARTLQCQNNLRQIGLAALGHERANGWLPTGGWGDCWVGDPGRGFGRDQPGGFFYNCLPYMEQQALHDLPLLAANADDRLQKALQMCATPLTVLSCPTRRLPALSPAEQGDLQLVNCAGPKAWFTTDYKCNGGSEPVFWGHGPASWAEAAAGVGFLDMSSSNGVAAQRSQVRMADILDGTSATYLVGEKYFNADQNSESDDDTSVDRAALSGDDNDLCGWTNQPPMPDTPGADNDLIFGSAHPSGFNMAFCDGSVQMMKYSIDPKIHQCLGNRKDGQSIDGTKW